MYFLEQPTDTAKEVGDQVRITAENQTLPPCWCNGVPALRSTTLMKKEERV